MENINITLDELTLMIKNIIENKELDIDNNFLLRDILKEQEELKKQNKILINELEDKNLHISSLEECIYPNDDIINKLNKKYYTVKNKLDEFKNYAKKILKQNDNLIIEHNKYIEEINSIKCKYKKNNNELKNNIIKLKENIDNIQNEHKHLKEKNILLEIETEELKKNNEKISNVESKQYNEIQKLNLTIKELNDELVELKENNLNYKKTILQELKISELVDEKNISFNNNLIIKGDKNLNKDINTDEEIKLNADNIYLFDKHITRKNIQHKNKLFFENELKQQEIKNNSKLNNDDNNSKISNNTNISFSTDYMVSYLKNDNKLKPKEERINVIKEDEEDNENYNLNVDIFQKNNLSSLTFSNIPENKINSSPEENYIDVSKINNIVINGDNPKNTTDKINVDIPKQNLNLIGGNNIKKQNNKPNNKMNIHIIDNIKKMYIGEELTTLTEQDINIEDNKKIHLTYNKKYKRYKREQEKNNKLIQEFK